MGALSHYDALFPARTIAAPKQPAKLARSTTELVMRYAFAGLDLTLDDYLNRHPVTGLLIARDDTILLERYQYGRTDTDRLTSFLGMPRSSAGIRRTPCCFVAVAADCLRCSANPSMVAVGARLYMVGTMG